MNKNYYFMDEYGMLCESGFNNDRDVLVELINSIIRMNNWWVVVESLESDKFSSLDVMDVMEKEVGELLVSKGVGEDNLFNSDINYIIGCDSNNIMSEDFYVYVCDDKGLDYVVEDESEYNESDYDKLLNYLNDFSEGELDNNIEKIVDNIIKYMDEVRLREIVEELKEGK